MAGYGWTNYDVREGGRQIINDTGNRLDLVTDFAKSSDDQGPGNWGLRIRGVPRSNALDTQRTTVVFYIGSEESPSETECTVRKIGSPSREDALCFGTISNVGNLLVNISSRRGDGYSHPKLSASSLTVPPDNLWQAKSLFIDLLKSNDCKEGMIANDTGEGNLQFIQFSFVGAFEYDILFSLESASEPMSNTFLSKAIGDSLTIFAERFGSTYSPQLPFQDERYIQFSKYLLSNLLGGIGYFYGTSKIDTSNAVEYAETHPNSAETAASAQPHSDVEERGPYQLFSATPSRPFFPRGFLWDEGFHLQVILDWDMDLALDIVSSWFDLMDENGWIAREQILGPEARSKVPPEYQTQCSHYANPPTLFLVVEAFVARLRGDVLYSGAPSRYLRDPDVGKAFLQNLYPKLKMNYEWFRRTQSGDLINYRSLGRDISEGYRWRGRTPQLTLTSGLDDYPRAQPPHSEELHIDALCWVGSMALALTKISTFLVEERDPKLFSQQLLNITRNIDDIHWSKPDQAYCDTTIREGNRVERVCHKGYVSLFPFLLGLLHPSHPNLGAVLELIRSPGELWSPYGVRSLSRHDPYYGTNENYWRSPVWIPINYLVLQQLLPLASQMGAHHQLAREMYVDLRQNLVETVFESWKKTGIVWEQYNPETGDGQRTQQFTGWTALIVRIMAMPDLDQPEDRHRQPQRPGLRGRIWNTQGYGMTLVVTLTGIMVTCFMFRKRLMRALWRFIRAYFCKYNG